MTTKTANTTTRNAELTKNKILQAAIKEFSERGYSRGRMDKIAELSGCNKRMIYYYYGDKDSLFAAIVEHEYMRFRKAETTLCSSDLPPVMALQRLIEFTWNYYLENPNYLTLVNSQNLFKAKHLEKSTHVLAAHHYSLEMLGSILKAGEEQGIFRSGVNVRQLHITIASMGFYYLSNRYTQSFLLQDDLMSKENLTERLHFIIDAIMRIVAK